MKKTVCVALVSAILLLLFGCDRSHLCSLDVLCTGSAGIVAEGETLSSFSFTSKGFNLQPLEFYTNIDFSDTEEGGSNANVYKFGLAASETRTHILSLKLTDANKYVIDFLRVGIVIDGEARVYKDYDKTEDLAEGENDELLPEFFSSKSEIFTRLSLDLTEGEIKEVSVFIWLEEAELYDKDGKRYTGWADKSYKASPIKLTLEIN